MSPASTASLPATTPRVPPTGRHRHPTAPAGRRPRRTARQSRRPNRPSRRSPAPSARRNAAPISPIFPSVDQLDRQPGEKAHLLAVEPAPSRDWRHCRQAPACRRPGRSPPSGRTRRRDGRSSCRCRRCRGARNSVRRSRAPKACRALRGRCRRDRGSNRGMRQPPLHALIGEVGEGMAERRQLPVEHRDHARRILGEDHVVQPEVAMHQRDPAVVGRHVSRARRSAGPCRECRRFREARYWPVQRLDWRS